MADEFLRKALQKAHIVGGKIWSHVVSTEEKCTPVDMADAALATALGGITFPLCLGVLQTGLFRPLRITSNHRLTGSFFGTVSLLVSGSTASVVFLSSVVILKENKSSSLRILIEKLHSFIPNRTVDVVVCSRDIPLCGVASLVAFKILGGRLRSVLPSSLIHPGAFAKRYIPAKGKKYASDGVKQKLALMAFTEVLPHNAGRIHGCHSCGKRWRTTFVGDHIPPNMLVKEGQKQRFYPQCRSCSYQQGAALSSNSKQLLIKTHGSSLRRYHLWLPLPIPLAVLRSYVKDKSEIQESPVKSDLESQEPDKLINATLKKVWKFLKLGGKDGGEDDKKS